MPASEQRARRFPTVCRTTDRALAKRRLADDMDNASTVLDVKVGKMTLEELLRLYAERLCQYAPKTIATRQSILKIFKQSWAARSRHSRSLGQYWTVGIVAGQPTRKS